MENYFNYFTEVEECFRKCRGTPTLLSTLDWALIESWKESGVPLEAVLLGIERTFEKFAKRRRPFRRVNGLGYCAQQVLAAAHELQTAAAEGGARREDESPPAPPFTAEEIRAYLDRNAGALEAAARYWSGQSESAVAADFEQAAQSLRRLAPPDPEKLQELEHWLSALEEKLVAAATRFSSVELLAKLRSEVERRLAPYCRNMSAPQIELVQRQMLKKLLLEDYRIPRLSLFYL